VGLDARPALRLMTVVALLAAAPARAGTSGYVEVQGQTTQTLSQPVGGPERTTAMSLLAETLSLHYAGLPFGPAVAVATAGGSFTNVNAWYGNGLQATGRTLSFDTSVGFLPRRAVPLRLFAGGTVVDGTSGPLATAGAGPSLVYGGSLNFEPGRLVPGLRLDVSESRFSRPGFADFSDRQRRLTASSFMAVKGQRLALALRLERDHREGAGDVTSNGLTFDWGSASHQTTLSATEVRRSLALLTGITSDRHLLAQSERRWAPSLSTQLAARYSEVEGGGATGTVGDARAAFTWRPIQSQQQLTLSAGANAGSTRTTSTSGVVTGRTYGGSGRASYGRQLGPASAGLSLGAASSTCDCRFGNQGTLTQLDATVSMALLPSARGSCQADWSLVRAMAPIGRGGDRLESHARASGRLVVGAASALTASLGYDDGQRELLDITTGSAVSLHERAVTASLGASTTLGRLYPSAEVRHARNTVVSGATSFVAGSPNQVRSVTSALASATWNLRDDLGLQGQLRGSWTELHDDRPLSTLGANLTLTWRLGRLLFTAQYQAARHQLGDDPASFQQSIRAVLSRPFEL